MKTPIDEYAFGECSNAVVYYPASASTYDTSFENTKAAVEYTIIDGKAHITNITGSAEDVDLSQKICGHDIVLSYTN